MRILFSLSLLLIFIFIPSSVKAMTIAPAIIDVKLDHGQSKTYEIKLYNESKGDLFLDGSVEKFIPRGETGQVQILPFDIVDKSINWLKLPNNSLVLKAGEEISVPLIISVPKTADIGGYYLVAMWTSSSGPKSEKSSQTLISSRVGLLILLEVTGQVSNNLEVVNFDLKNYQKFYNSLPIDFSLRLRNYGNIHQRPQGSIIIKNFIGQTIEALPFNAEKGAILPNTTRVFGTTWGSDQNQNWFSVLSNQLTHFTIGRFSAQALITYNNDKNLDSNLIYFWIISWPVLILVLFVLVVIIILTKILKKKSNK